MSVIYVIETKGPVKGVLNGWHAAALPSTIPGWSGNDLCPPQRVITRYLKEWLVENEINRGIWRITAYKDDNQATVSRSEEIDLDVATN